MVSAQTTATPDPEVICTEIDNGETVLLHMGTQTYFSLNQTGTRIWKLIGQGLTLGEIGRTLEAQYDVSAAQAQRSVIALANELAAEKLVTLNCVEQNI